MKGYSVFFLAVMLGLFFSTPSITRSYAATCILVCLAQPTLRPITPIVIMMARTILENQTPVNRNLRHVMQIL